MGIQTNGGWEKFCSHEKNCLFLAKLLQPALKIELIKYINFCLISEIFFSLSSPLEHIFKTLNEIPFNFRLS